MPTNTTGRPAWEDQLQTYLEGLREVPVVTKVDIPEGFDSALDLTIAGPAHLDLSNLPEGSNTQMRFAFVGGMHAVHLRHLDRSARLSLLLEEVNSQPDRVDVYLDSAFLGDVTLASGAGNRPLTIGAHDEYRGRVEIQSGTLALLRGFPAAAHVAVTGSTLRLESDRDYVTVRGTSSIDLPGGNVPRIMLLTVIGSADLRFPAKKAPIVVQLTGQSDAATLRFGSDYAGRDWTVEMLTDLRLEAQSAVQIRSKFVQDCKISGPAHLTLGTGSTVNSLTCSIDTGEQHPTLSADEDSVVDELSGTLTLGMVSKCHLIGSADGFLIADIKTSRNVPRAADHLAGSVLTGFRTPHGLAGRDVLAAMADTYHVDPDTADLPGSEHGLLQPLKRWKQHRSTSDRHRRQLDRGLRQDAELLRELQRLVIEKGAPGSTRTKVAWNAYRLRHRGVTSRVEYAVLAGYRLLGYGERPMPALFTWMAVSLCVAAISLGLKPDPTPHGLLTLLGEAGKQAVGPLTGLLYAGNSSLTSLWQHLARAAVAIPLVTGLLAFRNYVKSRQN
ncbi:hypothetical protein [Kribbella albertanoniae]|uniref:Uncharacterized protein n=1 Tax=Kribbella albertanoniae TaxID=1266829 RepID=A0A4R4Q8I4_9ACTN|nr:hypothetical protein [Kribbella albertanoniae]TDC31616.1 hypothetical protein E1261_10345 [Kribbella albertanoniae]